MKYIVQSTAGALGALLSFLYGEMTNAFLVLIALVCIDFCTGLAHAIVEQRLNSRICSKGIAKKVYILALVAVGHLIDNATGQNMCMTVVVFFYIANESMSIIENAGRMGLPVPEKLKSVIEQLNGKEV